MRRPPPNVARRVEPSSGTASASPPAWAATRQPRRHRLQRREREDLRVAGRDDGDRGVAAQGGELGRRNAAGEAHVAAERRAARRAAGRRPRSRAARPAVRHASIASANPFSGVRRPAASAKRPEAASDAAAKPRLTEMTCARSPERRAELAQAPQRERARHDERVDAAATSRRCQSASAGARRRGLGTRAAALQSHAGERVPAVAAGAVLAAGEAGADRAHEPVVVQVQHDPRARPRAPPPAPASRTPDARCARARPGRPSRRTAAATESGCRPPREQAERSARRARGAPSRARAPRLLAELAPDQPREVLDRALLAAGHAVAVVQEEDQRPSRRSSRPPQTTAAWNSGGISRRCQRERTCLSVNRVIEAVMCSSREATTPPSCRTRTVGR